MRAAQAPTTEAIHPVRLESLGTDVALACEAVRDATQFMRTAERDAVGYTLTKADVSPITAADFVVQAFVASRLARHFPDDPLVAEEDASALRADAASAICERVVELGIFLCKRQEFPTIKGGRFDLPQDTSFDPRQGRDRKKEWLLLSVAPFVARAQAARLQSTSTSHQTPRPLTP